MVFNGLMMFLAGLLFPYVKVPPFTGAPLAAAAFVAVGVPAAAAGLPAAAAVGAAVGAAVEAAWGALVGAVVGALVGATVGVAGVLPHAAMTATTETGAARKKSRRVSRKLILPLQAEVWIEIGPTIVEIGRASCRERVEI